MIVDSRVHDLPAVRVQQGPRFATRPAPRGVGRGRAKQAPRSAAVGSQVMRGRMQLAQLGELALSLKPPKWLRKAVSGVFAKTDAKVSVPTPGGPVSVDLKNPEDLQRLKDLLLSARLNVTTGGSSSSSSNPMANVNRQVQENVPGGWGTVAGLGGLALLGVMLATRPRRPQLVQAA